MNVGFRRFWLNFDLHRYDGFNFWPYNSKGYFGFRLAFITFIVGKYLQTHEECFQLDEIRFNLVKRRRERAYKIVSALQAEWPNLHMEGWDDLRAVEIILHEVA